MKTALAIKHVAFEDLGSWEPLIARHYHLRYLDAAIADLSQVKNNQIDLLIILGGPIGVYQENDYPFLSHEISLLEERLKNHQPTLGICLGSQLIARALGSKVYPNHTKEIGWDPLVLTEKGRNSCVRFLDSAYTSMFHWHGDTFDLPPQADLLASTQNCKNQIFSYENTLAFQCHPEIEAEKLEHWWIGHASELLQNNLSICNLRNVSKKLAPRLKTQSLICLETWIKKFNSTF